MELPTPETVLMEAMFDDPLADSYLKQFEIEDMVKQYTGVPVRRQVETIIMYKNLDPPMKPSKSEIDVCNRKLHTLGWHLERHKADRTQCRGSIYYDCSDLVLDKYNPPAERKLSFIQRIAKLLGLL
jgi:hypothetical protein